MGASQIKSALDLEAGHVLKGASNDTVKDKAAYINKIGETLEAHESAAKPIMANESLTQQGKMDALKTLATTKTAPALKWLRDEIEKLQKKDQRLRAQFYTVDSGIKDPVERLLMFTYLWSKLDPLDQAARVTQFAQASERDEVKVLAAMLDHPLGAMVTDEVKERLLLERAKRLTPRDVTNFEQNQILLEFLVMSRGWLVRLLSLELGLENAVIRATFGDEVADALSGVTRFVAA